MKLKILHRIEDILDKLSPKFGDWFYTHFIRRTG